MKSNFYYVNRINVAVRSELNKVCFFFLKGLRNLLHFNVKFKQIVEAAGLV